MAAAGQVATAEPQAQQAMSSSEVEMVEWVDPQAEGEGAPQVQRVPGMRLPAKRVQRQLREADRADQVEAVRQGVPLLQGLVGGEEAEMTVYPP